MWLRRLLPLSVILLIQLLFVADVLNRRAEDPQLDVAWAGVFSPLIVYLGLGFLFIIASYFMAGNTFAQNPRPSGSNMPNGQYQASVVAADQTLQKRREAKITAADATIDLIKLTLLAVFLGLLIDQLERIEDTEAQNERDWGNVFIPFFIFLVFVFIVATIVALRVSAEYRYQRELGCGSCCGATFGGVVCCCAADDAQLAYAADQRRDKRADYEENDGYHAIPCAFMCTPAMNYGVPDSILRWLWWLVPIALIITTALTVSRLESDDASPSVADIFIALWIVEGLMIITAFFLVMTLCCCYRRAASRPVGRASMFAKYGESTLLFFGGALLITQEALLAAQIDDQEGWDWNAVFSPLYVLFTLIIFVGCCYVKWCNTNNNDASYSTTMREPTMVSQGSARAIQAVQQPSGTRAVSMWGIFNFI